MIIIKYYEWLRIIPGEKHAVYESCEITVNPKTGEKETTSVKTLSKEDAKAIIAKNNMRIVRRNKHGVIWE